MNERNATIDIFGTKIGNAEEYDCDDDMNVNYVNCEFDDFFLQDNRLEKLKNFLNEKKEGDFIFL
jgi:hypothetical protein